MPYRVVFRSEVVLGQEPKLLTRMQQIDMLRALEDSPRSQKPLTGALQGCYRYRCGSIRTVFSVDEAAELVTVLVIGQRRDSEVYDEAEKRA